MLKPKVCFIDGSGFIFRAFFALPSLTTSAGQAIGGLLGFCNMILRLSEQRHFTHWAVVLDSAAPTFRHAQWPAYKAHRKAAPDALISQLSLIPELCKAFGIPTLCSPGFEADDIMASYGLWALSQGCTVELVTCDKDMMQLVQEDLWIYDPLKDRDIDAQAVEEKWGVKPCQVPDVQALAGDSSDNIPGIPGVGPKTAQGWIQRFGSLEDLLSQVTEIKEPKKRDLIQEYANQARMCYQLAKLGPNVAIEQDLPFFEKKPPAHQELDRFLTTYQLNSLRARLEDKGFLPSLAPIPVSLSPAFMTHTFLETLNGCQVGVYAEQDKIFLAPQEDQVFCLELSSTSFQEPAWTQFWHSPHIHKIFWDIKSFTQSFQSPWPLNADDVMVMSYLAQDCQSVSAIEDALRKWVTDARADDIVIHDTFNSHRTEPTPPLQNHGPCRAWALRRVYIKLASLLEEKALTDLYKDLDYPFINVLYNMENRGVCLDTEKLQAFSHHLETLMTAQEKVIHAKAGCTFNLGSPKQLGDVLFNQLGWPLEKKGKSGAWQTSSDVLKELAEKGYDLAEDILQWRQNQKLKTTYTDTLIQQACGSPPRLHTHFSMVTTSTGRLSSLNPNLQNIPLSYGDEPSIRSAFYATPGHTFLICDYSQIELRLLAHIGNVESLQDAFLHNIDIHKKTASDIFQTSLTDITPEQRRRAKVINFGILYGMSPFGLSKNLGISTKEAQAYIHAYFASYPGVEKYLSDTKAYARQYGYVRTLWGRRCAIPSIHSASALTRQAAERQATNAPLQGSSADILKKAMIDIHHFLKRQSPQNHLLLQIHDEIIVETPCDVVQDLAPQIVALMENAASLSVPLTVHYKIQDRWEAEKPSSL